MSEPNPRPPKPEGMTDAQYEAREKILELLSEFFDHYVLIVECEIDGGEYDQCTFWSGSHQGHSASVGLLEKYKAQLLEPR